MKTIKNYKTMDKTMDKTMRYLYTLTLASLLLLFGCDQGSNVTSPVNPSNQQEINWIALPTPSGLSVNAVSFTTSKMIDGSRRSMIFLEEEYQGGPFGTVSIHARLKFPKKSFNGEEEITMTCFPEEGTVKFGPSMVFDKDLQFTLEYTGVDLSGINSAKVDFCYIAADGSLETIGRKRLEVDFHNGKIKVQDANIKHFSRYGFVNRQK